MGRLEFAVVELVADVGPAEFAGQAGPNAVFDEQAALMGHDDGSGVQERHKADPNIAAKHIEDQLPKTGGSKTDSTLDSHRKVTK